FGSTRTSSDGSRAGTGGTSTRPAPSRLRYVVDADRAVAPRRRVTVPDAAVCMLVTAAGTAGSPGTESSGAFAEAPHYSHVPSTRVPSHSGCVQLTLTRAPPATRFGRPARAGTRERAPARGRGRSARCTARRGHGRRRWRARGPG